MERKKYIELKDLEVYQLSRQLSSLAWIIYEKIERQTKKVIGDQFLTATDSVGANIAEGYARYHYLDKVKFFLYSRASLSESVDHWLSLLEERCIIEASIAKEFQTIAKTLQIKLNNFITSTRKNKK